MQKKTQKEQIRMVAILGMLSALAVIFSLPAPTGLTFRVGEFLKFSPMFLAVALAGAMYGPVAGAMVAFIGDFFQALLSGLGISPLLLIVSVIDGIIYGYFLHKKNSIIRILLSVWLTQIICSLCLNTLILRFQYGMPIFPTIYWRGLQVAIMMVAETVLLILLLHVVNLPEKLKKIGR